MRSIALVACLLVGSAAAQEKRLYGRFYPDGVNTVCPAGQALTYSIQCDPGSRAMIDRVWNPRIPGAEICRARRVGCTVIEGLNPRARPGFEVQDTTASSNELVVVTFGLGSLLGDEE